MAADDAAPTALRAREALAELFFEAGGAWLGARKPDEGKPRRLEVKAVAAYAGKEERGGRIHRVGVARHVTVGAPAEFAHRAVAAIRRCHGLSEISRARRARQREVVPARRFVASLSEAAARFGSFRINRVVLSCFYDPKVGRGVLGIVDDEDVRGSLPADRGVRQARAGAVEALCSGGLLP